jgi:hypothetical protein
MPLALMDCPPPEATIADAAGVVEEVFTPGRETNPGGKAVVRLIELPSISGMKSFASTFDEKKATAERLI